MARVKGSRSVRPPRARPRRRSGLGPRRGTSAKEILSALRSSADPQAVEGMARFGIATQRAYGVSMPTLRGMARQIGRDHALAQELWASGIHEARILAGLIDEPRQVSEGQMEKWVAGFDSWDVCDQCCSNLFDKTPLAYRKAVEWSRREAEFVKRAGYVLMAALAVHEKRAGDEAFLRFLPLIQREASDPRNFVRKAVNWALRQIGKRNPALNRAAIQTAKEIQKSAAGRARWVAADALRELTSQAVQSRWRGVRQRDRHGAARSRKPPSVGKTSARRSV